MGDREGATGRGGPNGREVGEGEPLPPRQWPPVGSRSRGCLFACIMVKPTMTEGPFLCTALRPNTTHGSGPQWRQWPPLGGRSLLGDPVPKGGDVFMHRGDYCDDRGCRCSSSERAAAKMGPCYRSFRCDARIHFGPDKVYAFRHCPCCLEQRTAAKVEPLTASLLGTE